MPSGAAAVQSGAEVRPYAKTHTVRTFVNAAGETVLAVTPSHFDVSRPLREMAKNVIPRTAAGEEAPENPTLQDWGQLRSSTPDPVVQPAPQAGDENTRFSFPTAFNFEGTGMQYGTPPDPNGSVGNNQFVEMVNIRLQVWALNRASHLATSILGPVDNNTVWSGFGGPCELQNSGDPVVIYDKLANRWLISQLTAQPAGGVYHECVALSTTADATGSYYRYAFAGPPGHFIDYPHFGVWSDAYYMSGTALIPNGAGGLNYLGGIFAAMDRARMLAGDPNATWQVIEDPLEIGHVPADVDGFAPPPTGAPGIFLSRNTAGVNVFRMKVDFAVPAHTTRTKQAIVPVAPATSPCNDGACVPQPGTSIRLGPIGGVILMFRAAYRNFIDHESIVATHSVDPSVLGVASGVRWYDIRLSGPPDPACPGYPCLRQQGTIADNEQGRSRWLGATAMDGAENLLIGYSTSGKVPGAENHSIRTTGRARNDPLGVMTIAETTIATGTANSTQPRWGDYSSMSADPYDDCTLWYVNQYYASPDVWSTRVASASFPAGSGDGQCPPTACTARPPAPPAVTAATVEGDNRLRVSWTGNVPSPGSYAVERADGPCGGEGLYQPVGSVAGTQTSFLDPTVQGGHTYAYRVRAAADSGGRCQTLIASACVQATATGACHLPPVFAGATGADSAGQAACGVTVSWSPATSRCPLTPDMRYNVFRGASPDFVPSSSNRIATCAPGPSSYLDDDALDGGRSYYYVVRAEDGSTGNWGECGGGNEEQNRVLVAGTAYGPGFQEGSGTLTDAGGDGTSFLRLNVAGSGDTDDPSWRTVREADDFGANHTPGGLYAYRNAGPGSADLYAARECAEMQTPPFTAAADAVNLKYWERHQFEYRFEGVAVEYSVNGGPWLDAPNPSVDPSLGCSLDDATDGWETLSCTALPTNNGCGYTATKNAYTGPRGTGSSCSSFTTDALTGYAHRCHPFSGLTPGDAVRFRWRYTSDSGAAFRGFYLDDVEVSGVRLPNACTPNACGGQSEGRSCQDGSPCTIGDACAGGACVPGSVAPPPAEVTGLRVGPTLSWTALSGVVVYDVAGAALADLRTNATATATCLAQDVTATTFTDARPDPPPGEGRYYLVRARDACGAGTYGLDSASVERSLPAACP